MFLGATVAAAAVGAYFLQQQQQSWREQGDRRYPFQIENPSVGLGCCRRVLFLRFSIVCCLSLQLLLLQQLPSATAEGGSSSTAVAHGVASRPLSGNFWGVWKARVPE